ncbi:hypothetical protein MRX96_001958 [Rhipicephalus microplus]
MVRRIEVSSLPHTYGAIKSLTWTLRNDPPFGLGSTRSWVITAFLSFVMAMMMVGQQAAGVLFYGIVHTFDVSRQQASWPIG